MADEAISVTKERNLQSRKPRNATEGADSITLNEKWDKVDTLNTKERKAKEAWITTEVIMEGEAENQSVLALNNSVDSVEGDSA